MKNLLITEEEKRRILELHNSFYIQKNKFKIISEQGQPEALLYGKVPMAQTDSEFPNWLATNFPSVVNKYASSPYPWDANTINKIRNENSVNTDPVGQFINVGKKWDAHKAYMANQQQTQANLTKYKQDYAKEQNLKRMDNISKETKSAESEKFVAKGDNLDPNKVNRDARLRNEVEIEFFKKYGRKPTKDDFEKYDPIKDNDILQAIDWILWILKWAGPEAKLAASIVEVGEGIAYICIALSPEYENNISGRVSNVLNGLGKLFGLFNIKLTIPGLSSSIQKMIDFMGKGGFTKGVSDLIKKKIISASGFPNLANWIQVLVGMLAKVLGKNVVTVLTSIEQTILTPIYNMIKYLSPKVASYIDYFIKNLEVIISSINLAATILSTKEASVFFTNSETNALPSNPGVQATSTLPLQNVGATSVQANVLPNQR